MKIGDLLLGVCFECSRSYGAPVRELGGQPLLYCIELDAMLECSVLSHTLLPNFERISLLHPKVKLITTKQVPIELSVDLLLQVTEVIVRKEGALSIPWNGFTGGRICESLQQQRHE